MGVRVSSRVRDSLGSGVRVSSRFPSALLQFAPAPSSPSKIDGVDVGVGVRVEVWGGVRFRVGVKVCSRPASISAALLVFLCGGWVGVSVGDGVWA